MFYPARAHMDTFPQASLSLSDEVFVGPERLPEGLPADTTPEGIKAEMKQRVAEKSSEAGGGGAHASKQASFEVCLTAAKKFGYDLQVSG